MVWATQNNPAFIFSAFPTIHPVGLTCPEGWYTSAFFFQEVYMTATSLGQVVTFHVGFDIWTGKAV